MPKIQLRRLPRPAAALLFACALSAQIPNRLCSSDSAQGFADDHSARTRTDASGRYVVFDSEATNLVPGDTNGRRDVFLKDLGTGLTHLISQGMGGVPATGESSEPFVSFGGRYVVFTSRAPNLVLNDQNGATSDVFVYDRQLATMELVSRNHLGVAGNGNSSYGSISGDGRYVAFQSRATGMIVGGVANGVSDVYFRDLVTGIVTLVSHDGAGGAGNFASEHPRISRNGQIVAFDSAATNLVGGDGNNRRDVFTFDRLTGNVNRASLGPGGVEGDGDSSFPDLSDTGIDVVYQSFATNLVAADGNNRLDVFRSSTVGSGTIRVSVDGAGGELNDRSLQPAVSANGRYVAFVCGASNVYPGASGLDEIAVRDLVANTTSRASVSLAGGAPNGDCQSPSISDDGRFVVFVSSAPNLIFGKTIVLRDAIRADTNPPAIATAGTFGSGCAGSQGLVAFAPAAGSLPWIGTTFYLEGANAPATTFVIGILGFSNTVHQGTPLPASLAPLGMSGCDLLVAIDITEYAFSDAAGDFEFALAIPNDIIWRGVTVYAQAWVLDPGANAGGAIVSNGVDFAIGG